MSRRKPNGARGRVHAEAPRTIGRVQPDSPLKLLLLIGVVVGAVLIVHWPALSAGALALDDDEYVSSNPLVQQPGLAAAQQFLSEVRAPSTVRGYYQPLPMISLMLDWALGGRPDDLRAFHRTSLLLHLANTALVILLMQMLFGNSWVAASAGLLFGVHPLAVEPVSLVGERKTLLAACFALACLVMYVRYARRGGRVTYLACLVSFALALLSKPTAAPLPAVLLLMDWWPLRRLSRRTVLETMPFFALAIASAVVTSISQGRFEPAPARCFSFAQALLLLGHNLVFYPAKMIWPAHLSPFYALPENVSLSNALLLGSTVITAGAVLLLLASLHWTRAGMACALCYVALLLPTTIHKAYSPCVAWDRYVYLPSVGLLMLLAYLSTRLLAECRRANLRRAPAGLLSVAVGVAMMLGVAARWQSTHWRTTEALYTHMLRLAPDSAWLHYNFGLVLADQDRLEEAVLHFEQAAALQPDMEDLDNNLGNALAQEGRFEAAADHLQHAIRLKPSDAKCHNNLGNVLAAAGQTEQAIAQYGRALEIDPGFAAARQNLRLASDARPAGATQLQGEPVSSRPTVGRLVRAR